MRRGRTNRLPAPALGLWFVPGRYCSQLLHLLVGPSDEIGCKLSVDINRPTFMDFPAGLEGPAPYGDEHGGESLPDCLHGIVAETQVLWHGHRKGDQVRLMLFQSVQ
ncbi:hypothetical protein SDC9_110708 [bioreactor metagenome]|uniref:Uncharacterized protein n=1 Tax=bioreactor metagenome TaxID=1076179 RepID=A0A645BPV0_9ZZZZ